MKTASRIALILSLLIGLYACGGGGGGGSGGQQSVLRFVNASTDAARLDLTIEGEPVFTGITAGDASVFEAVQSGARLVRVEEPAGAKRALEIQNEFEFSTPYTLIVVNSGSNSFSPILAVNDRSDTAPAQFRVRAINASQRLPLVNVRLASASAGRSDDQQLPRLGALVRADGTVTATPTLTQTPASTAQATPTATATASASVSPSPTSQGSATPAASPSAAPSAVASAAPTSAPTIPANTPVPGSSLEVARELSFREVAGYTEIARGDYRIIVEANGAPVLTSGAISFQGGQIVSVIVRDAADSEGGGGIRLLRVQDKP